MARERKIATENETRIFLRHDEFWNIAVPVVFLVFMAFGLAEPSRWFGEPSFSSYFYQELVVDLVFLNITHNAFSVIMLFTLPELGAWRAHEEQGGRRFLLQAVALFGLLIFALWAGMLIRVPGFSTALLILGYTLSIHHALAQSLGLSLLYDRYERPSRPHERIERIGTMSLAAVLIVGFTVLSIERLRTPTLISGLSVSAVVIAIILTAVALMHPRKTRLKKALFSARYFVWAFSMLIPIGAIATRVIHGFEYLFVMRQMASKSAKGMPSWAIALLAATVLFAVVRIYLRSLNAFAAEPAFSEPLIIVISAVSIAFSFLHYYLDRRIFRMRNQSNKKYVASLFNAPRDPVG